ncbi:MAG: fibronectin type III-like domain-contianing protein, partial [Bacteroidota bacterium]
IPAYQANNIAGMEGGNALANILYGEANPSGKLPFSIAQKQEDYPVFQPFATKVKYDYYHGYTLFEKQNKATAYSFGFGLSYSDFSYANLQMERTKVSKDSTLSVSVEVTNTSDVAGKEVVQLYVGFSNSQVDRPVKLLRDFKKVELNPQESKVVKLEVKIEDLAWYNPDIEKWVVDAMEYELYVGGSSKESDLLKSSFIVD